jgi:glycosyltransferase involved in cell wall biosynthesis
MRLLHRIYTAATMPWAHVIVTPDRSQIETMPFIDQMSVVEIPLAASLFREGPAPSTSAGERALVIGTWGMLRKDKGVDLALDAFDIVSANIPTRFVIAGDPGPDRAYGALIAERIRRSPYADRVVRTGRLSEGELGGVITSFDVCVLPYPAGLERNRLTYATAIAAGVYTVTTTTGDPGFDETSNTSFVPPDDLDALVKAIEAAPLHPRHAPLDVAGAWKSIAVRHAEVYSRLASSRR